jgi:riboflavin synthase
VFTGIVRERGRIVAVRPASGGAELRVEAPETAAQAKIGDSVSVSGACLTVTEVEGPEVAFQAVPETLARTTLADLDAGSEVNLELALRAGEPLGGHYVQGHVDAVGRVRSLEPEGEGARLWIEADPDVMRYCVEKGSVAVDGVSLTIAELDEQAFAVALAPHTLAATTLSTLEPGRRVNLEVDVLAKYVEKLIRP